MPVVEMPDGVRLEFPDGMSREEMRSAIQSKYPTGNESEANVAALLPSAERQSDLAAEHKRGERLGATEQRIQNAADAIKPLASPFAYVLGVGQNVAARATGNPDVAHLAPGIPETVYEGLTRPEVDTRVSIPPVSETLIAEPTLQKIGVGTERFAEGLVNFLIGTPAGTAAIASGGFPATAKAAVHSAFLADMARQSPDQFKELVDAYKTGDVKKGTVAAENLLLTGVGVGIAGLKGAAEIARPAVAKLNEAIQDRKFNAASKQVAQDTALQLTDPRNAQLEVQNVLRRTLPEQTAADNARANHAPATAAALEATKPGAALNLEVLPPEIDVANIWRGASQAAKEKLIGKPFELRMLSWAQLTEPEKLAISQRIAQTKQIQPPALEATAAPETKAVEPVASPNSAVSLPKKPPQERMNPVDAHKFQDWASRQTVSRLRQLRDDHESDPTQHFDQIEEIINEAIASKSSLKEGGVRATAGKETPVSISSPSDDTPQKIAADLGLQFEDSPAAVMDENDPWFKALSPERQAEVRHGTEAKAWHFMPPKGSPNEGLSLHVRRGATREEITAAWSLKRERANKADAEHQAELEAKALAEKRAGDTPVQAPAPDRFETIDDLLKFRQQRISEEISLYEREIGLTAAEAKRLQDLMFREADTTRFEKSLTPEKQKALVNFFDNSPYNKIGGPFEFWEGDRRLNPESIAEETDKTALSSSIATAAQRGIEQKPTSDRFLTAAIAAKRLKELGGTQSDLARYVDDWSTRESSNQSDKLEFFQSVTKKVSDFLKSQGIELPEGDLGVRQRGPTGIPADAAAALNVGDEKAPPINNPLPETPSPAPKKPAPQTISEHLRTADRPSITVPEGALQIRVTDSKGRKAIEKVDDLKKGNPFRGVDIAKVEAGTITKDGKFQVTPGEVTVKPPKPLSDELADTSGDAEINLQARHGTASGLPKSVPDRGPSFPSELMEASRRLDALVRSRATLRPGVLGQYVRTTSRDRIEVGDIRNQATTAHEIGHALDATLFPSVFPGRSQQSLLARVGTGTKRELFNELKAVSELMRGPFTGSKGHIQYRQGAVELIADYFSLYAHDPAQAKAMAPKFTAGFEKAVAAHPEAGPIVSELLAGNVKPEAPFNASGMSATGTPAGMAGQVPARPSSVALPRERGVALAAQGLVKDAVRTLEAYKQSARIRADNWRKAVPNESARNDVGAFIEGIGNLEKKGDTIADVEARMTPAMQRFAKEYRYQQELQRQEINDYLKDSEQGEYLKFLEDYLGHFYVDGKTKIQSALGRFIKESPHAKARKLPTLKEAVDLGLKPITQDPSKTYELTADVNWRVATNRKFVAELKNLRTASNEPVVVPPKDAPAGYVITDNPLIQRVYARQTPGGTMLWRGGAAIHPDAWPAARQILDTPTSSDLARAYDAINAVTRANAFAFSFFHDISLRAAAAGAMMSPHAPLRGLVRLMERDPVTGDLKLIQSTRSAGKRLLTQEEAVMDAAQHGLKFAWTDSEAYQKNARGFLEKAAVLVRDVPVLGKAAKVARDLQQMRQEGLWRNTHDAFKMIAYHDLVSKALSDAPAGTDVRLVKERVASLLNDAFGGQEWQTKFWLEPKVRQAMSRFLLAPDWTVSTLRSVPLVSDLASSVRSQAPRLAGREAMPVNMEGASGNVGRLRFWGGEVAAIAMATVAAQYAIHKMFGDDKKGDKSFPWENEYNSRYRVDVSPLMRKMPWHDPNDKTRRYVNLGKRAAEIVRWVTSPEENIESKASRPVAELFKQVTGTEGNFKAEWKRDHESFLESVPSRLASIGKEALPFSLTGSQFVLSVPMAKGMTKYKAQEAYESVYELAADPNRFKSLLRGQPASEGSLKSMVEQISDAASKNGVNAEEVRKKALSIVRGYHYGLYFKAMKSGDKEALAKESDILFHRLGATNKGLQESVRNRKKVEQK